MATTAVSEQGGEASGSSKGGRNLRKRETAACPLCFNTFFSGELESHVSACLYFLEEAGERKKHKKAKTSPLKNTNKMVIDSATPQKLSTPNPKSNISPLNSHTNSVPSPHHRQSSDTKSPPKLSTTQPSEKWAGSVADWNLQEAPVFRPTTEEFQHPLRYIAAIRPIAEKYGICRIIPPYPCETWNKNIDPTSFIFKTKVQNIHQLKTRWQGPNEVFVSGLCAFHDKRGTPLKIVPKVDGRDLDLFKLFLTVVKMGGMQEVTRRDLWKSIADELRVSDSNHRATSALRGHYYKVLYPYELYRKNKLHHTNQSSNKPNITGTANLGLSVAEEIKTECFRPNPDVVPQRLNDSVDVETDNEFGFYEGKYFILQKFERMAHAFQRKWFPDVKKPDPNVVESEFWRIVETAEENVQVHYGSDLDVTQHSSGFPRDAPPPSTSISPPLSHWNLNHLPRMEGSVLRHITEAISGVIDPMIYVGMLYSSFCWHTEDNYLYSINYLHKGACKTWYGVPSSAAEHFESVMKEAVPELFIKHPDLLHLLITMISPSVLVKNKVPVYHTLQEPGQYVITFPQAYHAGFSHGFTCGEAVNFALADWLPYGASSVDSYRTTLRSGVFSNDQLLCALAQKDASPETAFFLYPEIKKMRESEQKARDLLRVAGLTMQMASATLTDGEPSQCRFCRYDCYLSSVTCSCSPNSVACLKHAEQLCDCPMRKKTIQVRVPLNIIDDLVTIVEKKVGQPPLQKLPPSMIRVQKPATTSNLISTKENFVNSTPSNPSVKNTSGEAIKVEQLPERRALKDTSFSAEKLYHKHIPPPPSLPNSTITYTPVLLTDLTASVPTTTTHYIPKVQPRTGDGGVLAPAPAKPAAPVAVKTVPPPPTTPITPFVKLTPPLPTPTPAPAKATITPFTTIPFSPPPRAIVTAPPRAIPSPPPFDPPSPESPPHIPVIDLEPPSPPKQQPTIPMASVPSPVPSPSSVNSASQSFINSAQAHRDLQKKLQRQVGRSRVAPVNMPVPDVAQRKKP